MSFVQLDQKNDRLFWVSKFDLLWLTDDTCIRSKISLCNSLIHGYENLWLSEVNVHMRNVIGKTDTFWTKWYFRHINFEFNGLTGKKKLNGRLKPTVKLWCVFMSIMQEEKTRYSNMKS